MAAQDPQHAHNSYDVSHNRLFNKGDRIELQDGRTATVKFYGPVALWQNQHENGHFHVGIALDEPTGKHDGRVNGRRYFHCHRQHGLFVHPKHCKKLTTTHSANQWRVRGNHRYHHHRNNRGNRPHNHHHHIGHRSNRRDTHSMAHHDHNYRDSGGRGRGRNHNHSEVNNSRSMDYSNHNNARSNHNSHSNQNGIPSLHEYNANHSNHGANHTTNHSNHNILQSKHRRIQSMPNVHGQYHSVPPDANPVNAVNSRPPPLRSMDTQSVHRMQSSFPPLFAHNGSIRSNTGINGGNVANPNISSIPTNPSLSSNGNSHISNPSAANRQTHPNEVATYQPSMQIPMMVSPLPVNNTLSTAAFIPNPNINNSITNSSSSTNRMPSGMAPGLAPGIAPGLAPSHPNVAQATTSHIANTTNSNATALNGVNSNLTANGTTSITGGITNPSNNQMASYPVAALGTIPLTHQYINLHNSSIPGSLYSIFKSNPNSLLSYPHTLSTVSRLSYQGLVDNQGRIALDNQSQSNGNSSGPTPIRRVQSHPNTNGHTNPSNGSNPGSNSNGVHGVRPKKSLSPPSEMNPMVKNRDSVHGLGVHGVGAVNAHTINGRNGVNGIIEPQTPLSPAMNDNELLNAQDDDVKVSEKEMTQMSDVCGDREKVDKSLKSLSTKDSIQDSIRDSGSGDSEVVHTLDTNESLDDIDNESNGDDDDDEDKKWDLSRFKPDDDGKFLSNMEDPDDIKDDNDYLALKLERRRSYPFVESELHLGKLLRIRSQVNDRLRHEKRRLRAEIWEVQNTTTELEEKNKALTEQNKENQHRLQRIKKDIRCILESEDGDSDRIGMAQSKLVNLFEDYLKDIDAEANDLDVMDGNGSDQSEQFENMTLDRSPALSIKAQESGLNKADVIVIPIDDMKTPIGDEMRDIDLLPPPSDSKMDKKSNNRSITESNLKRMPMATNLVERARSESEYSIVTDMTNNTTVALHHGAPGVNPKYRGTNTMDKLTGLNLKYGGHGAKLQRRRIQNWQNQNNRGYSGGSIQENSTTPHDGASTCNDGNDSSPRHGAVSAVGVEDSEMFIQDWIQQMCATFGTEKCARYLRKNFPVGMGQNLKNMSVGMSATASPSPSIDSQVLMPPKMKDEV